MSVPAITRAILLRHGQTDWNNARRWQGRADIPLNAAGVAQAQRAAAELVADTDIAQIVHSSASRAAQTASVISGAFDLAGRPVPSRASDLLVEIDVGEWSGLTHGEVFERYPDVMAALERGEDVPRGVTGERLAEAGERVRAEFDRVVAGPGSGTALFVMHGAVIRALATNLTGLPPAAAFHALTQVGNCCWVEVTWDEGHDWRIHRWNVGA